MYRCKARGRFKKEKITPLVGDKVKFTETGKDEGVIEDLYPRECKLNRPPIANVQMVVFLFSVKDPPLNLMLLDRLLVLLESQCLEAVICFNKVDLIDVGEINPVEDLYRDIGYRVILTSALKKQGINEVRECLRNKISVIAGPSGSGKSTLLNNIEEGLELKVGSISSKSRRGKQTTRHVELLSLKFGGLVADSPGFNQIDLKDIKSEELAYYFPEFIPYGERCKFNGCKHIHEPSCAVKDALDREEISSSRYRHYTTFLDEIKENERSF